MMELLDLDNLTEEERTIILNVIRRDDELRRRQENRIRLELLLLELTSFALTCSVIIPKDFTVGGF